MKLQFRLLVIAMSLFMLFSLLIGQYFRIQILQGDKWSKKARAQHEIIVQQPFRRGAFFANTSLKKDEEKKKRPFVVDVAKFHLYADPLAIDEKYRVQISNHLTDLIGEKSNFVQLLEKKTHNYKLAMWLDQGQKSAILKWWYPFAKKRKIASNALYFAGDYKRSYPYGTLLGQVLHTIRDLKDETTKEGVPTGGLESYFNELLTGKQGKKRLLRSPLNRLDLDQLLEPSEHGADIYLTVNPTIQAIVEEELAKGVSHAGASGGWAVMLDPHQGHILALAQYPFFDPRNYSHYFNDPSKINESKVKAITDAFELGSIMKPITVALALLANEELEKKGKAALFDPNEAIDVRRGYFPGRMTKPMKDMPSHLALNMNMALQKSSNIYMATMVDRMVTQLGKQWYREQLIDRFGFGCKTGVELPAEATGFIPRFNKTHANGALEWSKSTPYSLAIGYNMLATSLQMVRAFSVFANGGYLIEPTLIRKIVKEDGSGGETTLFDHSTKKKKVLSSKLAKAVRDALKFTTKPGGTGRLAEIYGYTEAGKTGTAEKIIDGKYCRKRHTSSFIGFAPATSDDFSKTQFVLIVTIDDPEARILESGVKCYMGGRCAAPVFKQISKRTLHYLGTPLDDPHGFPTKDPRYDPEKADWMPEVKELKVLYNKWNKK